MHACSTYHTPHRLLLGQSTMKDLVEAAEMKAEEAKGERGAELKTEEAGVEQAGEGKRGKVCA